MLPVTLKQSQLHAVSAIFTHPSSKAPCTIYSESVALQAHAVTVRTMPTAKTEACNSAYKVVGAGEGIDKQNVAAG